MMLENIVERKIFGYTREECSAPFRSAITEQEIVAILNTQSHRQIICESICDYVIPCELISDYCKYTT